MDVTEIFREVGAWIEGVDAKYTEDVRENSIDEVAHLFEEVYAAMVRFACADTERNHDVTISVAEAFASAWADSGTHDPILIKKMRPDVRKIILEILSRTQSEELKLQGLL